MSKIAEAVFSLIEKPVEELGYDLVDVEYKKENVGMVLTVYIDRKGGVGIDDCETVSRLIDPLLDEADPIPGSYCLSVSSPGLDRPLKSERDFQRKMGEKVSVKLYAPIEKKRELLGILKAYDADSITIEWDGEEKNIRKKEIAVVKPWFEF